MTFSYNPDLSTAVSRVRQRLGDTSNTAPFLALVQDETITAYLVSLTELKTASRLTRDISAQYARLVDSEGDRQNSKASQLSKQYAELAARLEAEAMQEQGAPSAPSSITV